MNFNKFKEKSLNDLTSVQYETLWSEAWDWNIDIRKYNKNTKVKTIIALIEKEKKSFYKTMKPILKGGKVIKRPDQKNLIINQYSKILKQLENMKLADSKGLWKFQKDIDKAKSFNKKRAKMIEIIKDLINRVRDD